MTADAQFVTLADGKANLIHEVTADGVWVETERTRTAGRPAQLAPAWMIQIAWYWLQVHGRLTDRFLSRTTRSTSSVRASCARCERGCQGLR